MSVRRAPAGVPQHVAQLQKELGDLKATATAAAQADSLSAAGAENASVAPNTPSFDSLSETEKSAASLGVDPSAWKPIAFVNESHYDTLLKSNAIDVDLAKKLEAHRAVASGIA